MGKVTIEKVVYPDNRDVIRDASGRYGCPNCWHDKMGYLVKEDAFCGECGARIDWSETH